MRSRQVIDDWEQFKQKYEKAINSKKPLLNITLYGSYYPAQEKKLLIELKKLLIRHGYHKTILVKDKQSPGDDPLEISQQCMRFSNINLLIFTLRGKRHGVIDELAFLKLCCTIHLFLRTLSIRLHLHSNKHVIQ